MVFNDQYHALCLGVGHGHFVLATFKRIARLGRPSRILALQNRQEKSPRGQSEFKELLSALEP
jgi:hypothetical protein